MDSSQNPWSNNDSNDIVGNPQPIEPKVEPVITNQPILPVETPQETVLSAETPADNFGRYVPPTPPVNPPLEMKNGGKISGKMVKIGIAIIAVLVLSFLAFKILIPGAVKSQEVNLTYWGLWESNNIIEPIIAEFQKANPNIKITYVSGSPKQYRERLVSAFAQNKGPDIFRFHNTWVPMLKDELSAIPGNVMDAGTFESLYYPVARTDLKVGNSYVGIPLMVDGLAMFINDDIFRTAGKTPPKTWDELRKTAKELTTPANRETKGQVQIAGVALGRTENVDHWSDILGVMMLQNGANLAIPTGNLAEDALTFFTLFSKIDLVWDETLPSSTQAFARNKLAIYFGPSWEAFTLKEINPDLHFTILPIPQLEDTQVTWASYWVEGVSKKSVNQEAAWKFVKFLSEKDTTEKLYNLEAGARLFGEPYARVDMAEKLASNDYLKAYIEQMPSAKSWYLASNTYDNGINDRIIKYFENAVNSVNAGETAVDALSTASTGVAQILSQYGLSSPVIR